MTISQRENISGFLFTDLIFYGINSPFWMYENFLSSTCLEVRGNVLSLILLTVFDTGSFIVLLYLFYSLHVGYLSVQICLTMYNNVSKKERRKIWGISSHMLHLEYLQFMSLSLVIFYQTRRSESSLFYQLYCHDVTFWTFCVFFILFYCNDHRCRSKDLMGQGFLTLMINHSLINYTI